MADSVSSSTSVTSGGPAIQFGGVTSGLDTKSLIDALLQADTSRVTGYQNQIKTLGDRRSAYSTLQTQLGAFLGKLQAFTMLKSGSSRSATSGDTTKFTALATTAAVVGQYSIDVDHLATATVATSTGRVGTAITDPAQHLADLPFAGSVKGGKLTVTVDGQTVSVTVGDPATTTLQQAMDAIGAAVQSKLGGDGTATVSVADNHLQVAIAGNASSHTLLMGGTGDTSNLFSLAGLTGRSATITGGGGALAGTYEAGVVKTQVALDSAGLTGLASTTTGKLTINGVDISYDTTIDSLSTVLSRINSSQAGVVASVDRTNDKIILTNKTAGAQPIVLADTGTLLASLNLAPGTTNAQTIGQNALLYVNDRPIESATNQVTNAIDNVTINLVAPTTSAVNLTVDVDQSKIETALGDLVSSYNSLADTLDGMTTNESGTTGGVLASDLSVRNLLSSIRSLIFGKFEGAAGSIQSLADVGVTTGKIGSTVGSTSRLTLDTEKLHKALASDPGGVASLLGSSGVLSSAVSSIKLWTDYGGNITTRQRSIDDQVRSLTQQSIDAVERLDAKRAALEAKYAKMESTLSSMQQTLASLSNQTAQMNK